MRPDLKEHKKMEQVRDRLETVEDFMMWLYRNGYVIEGDKGTITPDHKLPYAYFSIDEEQLEKEKQQAVNWLLHY